MIIMDPWQFWTLIIAIVAGWCGTGAFGMLWWMERSRTSRRKRLW